MKKCISSIFIFSLLIVLLSCEKDSEQDCSFMQNEEYNSDSEFLISRDVVNITAKDAVTVASLFYKQTFGIETRSNEKTFVNSNISAVRDKDDNPLIYVVNNTNNGGFVVISATKNYQAILAYSDKGCFDLEQLSDGAEGYLEQYIEDIGLVVNKDIDSLRVKYATSWTSFETPIKEIETKSSISALKEAQIAYWSKQGYECHTLAGAKYYMSEEKAAGFVRDICANTDPKYDCMDVTILLIKRGSYSNGPLLQTIWGQKMPFNIDASNGVAGCGPIAMAQIMRYHQWPTNAYTWSQIPINATETAETHRFIKDIRSKTKAKYDKNATTTKIDDVSAAFRQYDYSTNVSNYYGYSERRDVGSEIAWNKPVYMRGETSGGDGHAWVCDGYKYQTIQYAAAMVLNEGPSEYFFFTGFTERSSEYFHMNWGHAGDFDGWFYSDLVNYNSTTNYNKDRKYMTIRPNK